MAGHLNTQSTDSIVWDVKSNFRYKAGIQFYSQTCKGHTWPNHREMWVLDDWRHTPFDCGAKKARKSVTVRGPSATGARRIGEQVMGASRLVTIAATPAAIIRAGQF